MMHSILIIGQSNMAGRGHAAEVEPIVNKRVKVLRNGRWRSLYTPVNPDRDTAGVNLVESFADLYSKDKDVDVGIIPCADGGTNLNQWQEGSLLFDHACYMAELASRTSNIAAVLWHQGESDCSSELCTEYERKLSAIFDAFRKKLDLYDVPFIVGGLGDFLADYPGDMAKFYPEINKSLQHYASVHPMTGFVSAVGLTSNKDNLHFNAPSLREFGVRYYNEFIKHEDKNKVFYEKSTPDAAIRTNIELL